MARPHQLLFVCTGNICRSPMAEYLARSHAESSGLEAVVKSAGTLGLKDRGAEPSMVTVGAEIGIDLSPHVCQPLTEALCAWADHILVMEYAHVGEAQHLGGGEKVELLGRYVDVEEIGDPIGSWFTYKFRRSRDQVKLAVERFLDTLPTEHLDS